MNALATDALVHIVMPVYNGMPFLPRAIESLLAQTHTRFEVWFGDDGSTDGSLEYLRTIADPRFHLVLGKSGGGLFQNLNRLLESVEAPYTRILCQDDWLEPQCLERELDFFEARPSLAMIFSKHCAMSGDGALLSETALGDLPAVLPPQLAVQHFFYHGCIPGNLSAVTLRTSILRGMGGFDPAFTVSGDYELWARIAAHYPLGVVHERLVAIRTHAGQLSRASASMVPFIRQNALVRRALLPFMPKHLRHEIEEFEIRRHRVLDFHQALYCLRSLRWPEAGAIFSQIGRKDLPRVAAAWVATLNNRRRPQAPWVMAALP